MERERKIKLATSLCVCLLFALVLVVVGQVVSIVTLRRKQARLSEELEKLNGEQTTMEELVAWRESNRYVEQYAREVLGMTKPQEEEEENEG